MGGKSSAVTYSSGGGQTSTVFSGAFKGRSLGGGSRSHIYGTRCVYCISALGNHLRRLPSVYGSGYPHRPFGSSGVAGQPFPYYHYPIVWESPYPASLYPAHLSPSQEYGPPSYVLRPGGALMQAMLQSNSTKSTFYFLADNSTVFAVLSIIRAYCSRHGNLDNKTSSSVGVAYPEASGSAPLAVDALQYYRASSAVLTLDGYNNTVALSASPNVSPLPLPAEVDRTLLTCLNASIGAAIPLVDAPTKFRHSDGGYILIVFGVLIGIMGLIILVPSIVARCFGCKHDFLRSRPEQDIFPRCRF